MIDSLTVANLKKGSKIASHGGEVFSLNTCQRTLSIGLGHIPLKFVEKADSVVNIFQGADAYKFLLETILGLQSEVIAEYEVVNQFKECFQDYLKKEDRNTFIITILEKLFQDQKKIRTQYLTELGQLSYAGIARKLIHNNAMTESVLIVGSGKLSHDLINLLKKQYTVFVTARNTEKLSELKKIHNIQTIDWLDLNQYSNHPFIVNTIGTDEVIFNESFFNNWNEQNFLTPTKLFIDLGSPSVIQTTLTKNDGVLRLEDIFLESVKLGREKMEKVENAKLAIKELTFLRHQNFSMSIPFGWEELQFA